MRLLITGTRGFVGGMLAAHLRARGHDVYGLVRRADVAVRELRVDLAQALDFEHLPRRSFDAIIHAAGLVGGRHFSTEIMEVNAEGTRRLVSWARWAGCGHFIQVSSVGVYGLRIVGQERTELVTPRSQSVLAMAYMRSKARAEIYIEDSGLARTILRLPSIIGPGDTFTTPAILSSLLGGMIPHAGRRDRKVSIIGIKNVAAVVERVLELGPLEDAFNCADSDVAWEDLVSHYAAQLGITPCWRRQSALRLLLRPSDRAYQYLMTNSWLGSQFPSDRLWARLGIAPAADWRDAVRDAVHALMVSGDLPASNFLAPEPVYA